MRLNLGSNDALTGGLGLEKLIGFINVDSKQLPGVHVVCDIQILPEKWQGKAVEIRASHVIDRMEYRDAVAAVKSWGSTLRVGGMLRLFCPNFRKLSEDWLAGRITIDDYSNWLFGPSWSGPNTNRSVYDQTRLNGLVSGAGLKIVGTKPRPNTYRYDLGVQAIRVK